MRADVNPARQCFFVGTEGTLQIDERADLPLRLRTPSGERPLPVEPGPRSGPDTTRACLLDFLAALAEGRAVPGGDLALARRSLQVIVAAYRSAASGARVVLS